MAGVAPSKRITKEEETRYKAAVSESVAQKLAGSANFINLFQYDQKDFRLNGPFSHTGAHTGCDGIYIFPFAAEIINIGVYCETQGSSGTTEVDVKKATSSSGSFASIFSTTPKVSSAASANIFWLCYDITTALSTAPHYQTWAAATAPTGGTNAVLSGGAPYNVDAGDCIRLDLISVAVNAANFQLIVFHRPRNE